MLSSRAGLIVLVADIVCWCPSVEASTAHTDPCLCPTGMRPIACTTSGIYNAVPFMNLFNDTVVSREVAWQQFRVHKLSECIATFTTVMYLVMHRAVELNFSELKAAHAKLISVEEFLYELKQDAYERETLVFAANFLGRTRTLIKITMDLLAIYKGGVTKLSRLIVVESANEGLPGPLGDLASEFAGEVFDRLELGDFKSTKTLIPKLHEAARSAEKSYNVKKAFEQKGGQILHKVSADVVQAAKKPQATRLVLKQEVVSDGIQLLFDLQESPGVFAVVACMVTTNQQCLLHPSVKNMISKQNMALDSIRDDITRSQKLADSLKNDVSAFERVDRVLRLVKATFAMSSVVADAFMVGDILVEVSAAAGADGRSLCQVGGCCVISNTLLTNLPPDVNQALARAGRAAYKSLRPIRKTMLFAEELTEKVVNISAGLCIKYFNESCEAVCENVTKSVIDLCCQSEGTLSLCSDLGAVTTSAVVAGMGAAGVSAASWVGWTYASERISHAALCVAVIPLMLAFPDVFAGLAADYWVYCNPLGLAEVSKKGALTREQAGQDRWWARLSAAACVVIACFSVGVAIAAVAACCKRGLNCSNNGLNEPLLT